MKRRGALIAGVALGAALLAAAAGAAFLAGYRRGSARSFLRDRREAEAPEVSLAGPPEWQKPPPAPDPGPVVNVPQPQPPLPPSPVEQPPVPAPEAPFAIDLSRPLRISWPLDVGPDSYPDRPDARVCLRARQGVNEIQEPGTGKALYPFRVARAGNYAAWLRVRWVDDGVGSVDCNNSWFAGFDDQPAAVVGNEEVDTAWFWARGPAARLEAGVHWLRIELREDGPLADRAVLLPAGADSRPAALEAVPPAAFAGLAGSSPPGEPQHPVQSVEAHILPTGSLAIAAGHSNEITLGLWWQGPGCGPDAAGFSGVLEVACPTAPGLAVEGEAGVRVGPAEPFLRRTLSLRFPPNPSRRPHPVTVTLRGSEPGAKALHKATVRFVRGPAWAFLGPFVSAQDGKVPDCDRKPMGLAGRRPPAELRLGQFPLSGKRDPAEWRIVADGSCDDWTGAVDLNKVFGKTNSAWAYAVTWIRAGTRLQHRSFVFQADDSGWLWMNGATVAIQPLNLPREAQRLWCSAQLEPGANPVVVKVRQTDRYWGFRFDVVDWHWQGRRGDGIAGLEPEAWPK